MRASNRVLLISAIAVFTVMLCWYVAGIPGRMPNYDLLERQGAYSQEAFAQSAYAHYAGGIVGGILVATALATMRLRIGVRFACWTVFGVAVGLAIMATRNGFLYMTGLGMLVITALDVTRPRKGG